MTSLHIPIRKIVRDYPDPLDRQGMLVELAAANKAPLSLVMASAAEVEQEIADRQAEAQRRREGKPATTPADAWPEPQRLPDGLPPVEPVTINLLPEVFQPWIEDIADRMQCPPDYPAIGAMVALAGTVGKQIGIRPKRKDDWTVIPNLWGGVVGRPGVMKSPALTEILKPLQRLEIAAKEEFEKETFAHLAGKVIAEEQDKVSRGKIRAALKNGEDAAQFAQEALESEQSEPIRRRFLVNDPTVEKLGELLNQNSNGLLLFRDELTGFLRTLDKEGHENARSFYLESWNGDSRYTYDRIGRGTIEIEHACLSILGGIQPGPLLDYMRSIPDDGLMQRFQLLVWPDIIGDWHDVDRWPNSDAKNAAYAVFERLANLDTSTIEATQDDGAIPYLRFADDAQDLFSEWRSELEKRLRQDDLPLALEAHLAKYRSLIPTLGLLIHLAEGKPGPVDLYALERACAWGEYLESHAKRIYAPMIAPDRIGARALAKRLLAGDLSDRFTLRDVYNRDWSNLNNRDAAHKAAMTLLDLDWLSEEIEQTGGRPRTWYVVNPRIKERSL